MPLGRIGHDANSQLLIGLFTQDPGEAHGWLPGGHLHADLLVLLRVYLGWRCTAKLQLSLPIRSLPAPRLGQPSIWLGQTAVLGLNPSAETTQAHTTITLNLGRYAGLTVHSKTRESQHVTYRF
jgi:type VI secretion system protein ImpH